MQATPLPKLQIFLALLVQLSEPVTAMVIYPFITKALKWTGITDGDEKATGYYAGIIESIFFVSEALSVYHWGRASDFYGRKPILLIGPLGLAFAVLGFGLSKSFWGMVIARAAMGVFNGNIGVSKTLMAEATDESNRADAFTLSPIVWTIGTTLGPTFGGVLADPSARWPHIFGRFPLFTEFPWFLPCFAAGLLAFLAFIFSYWGLKETLPRKVKPKVSETLSLLNDSSETPPSYGSLQTEADSMSPGTPSARALLGDWKMRVTLASMGFLAFTDMSYVSLIPLIYSTSISVGGLGLSPYQIGLILGLFGLFNGIWNWLVLTRILKKLGTRKTLILGYTLYLVHFSLLWILRDVAGYIGKVTPLVWALLILQLFISTTINTAYNAMHLLIVATAPPNALGSVNGLAQMVSSGSRGFAPAIASSLFSLSLELRIANGHLVEIVLLGVTLVGIFCMSQLPI